MSLSVSCQFDGGSIEVLSIEDPHKVNLKIRKDNASDFAQWFYFALQGQAGQIVEVRITGLTTSAYPKGWENYKPLISANRVVWERTPAHFDGDSLIFNVQLAASTVYCAYFEPYSYDRYLDFVAQCESYPYLSAQVLGSSLQGRSLHLLRVTENEDPLPLAKRKKVWLIARQHPGETMASWFMEGFLQRLLDPNHALATGLRKSCIFYIIPHMNPDGGSLGNLRTNYAGANLNREWSKPSLEKSPEVYLTRQAMMQIGVDLFLDIHGDESLPYVFLAGSEGTPNYHEARAAQEKQFIQAWGKVCPDIQSKIGYEKDTPGSANLSLATNWVAQNFNCLAYTLEMPFKDNANCPDELFGWSSERCAQLGAECLFAIQEVILG